MFDMHSVLFYGRCLRYSNQVLQAVLATSSRIRALILNSTLFTVEQAVLNDAAKQLQPSPPAPSQPHFLRAKFSGDVIPLPYHICRSLRSRNCLSIHGRVYHPLPPSALPLSARIPLPFPAQGQNFWAVVQGTVEEFSLNLTFGLEEQQLFDDDFLSERRMEVADMMNHSFQRLFTVFTPCVPAARSLTRLAVI
jgi:hypothetical protein